MRKLIALAVLLASTVLLGVDGHAAALNEPWSTEVAPGVRVERIVRHGPALVLHVARLAPGARYSLRPVLAHDRIGDPAISRQPVSDMCRRAGGVVCINADFAACPTCRSPFGGIVADGRVLRSFNPAHGQVSQVDGRLTSDMLAWGGALRARYVSWRELPGLLGQPPRRIDERQQQDELSIAGINIDPVPGGIVLYTPEWGGATPPTPVQVTIATPVPIGTGSLTAQIVGRHEGPTPLGNDSVLAATGDAAGRLSSFADRWLHGNDNEKHLDLVTAVSHPASFSVGGHPVLLRQGRTQDWYRGDRKAVGRHPRTLLGWNAAGEVLLVTADGRQAGVSDGLTLDEAADVLRSLGATEGINLDGGGSTTFVGPCASGPCVLNRPSDGRERLVPVALAVVGDRIGVRPVATERRTPLLPPAPPPEDDPASSAHGPVAPPPVATPAASADAPATELLPDGIDVAMRAGLREALGASRLFARDIVGTLPATESPDRDRGIALPLALAAVVTGAFAVGRRLKWRRRRR